jgi:hypothetical protein
LTPPSLRFPLLACGLSRGSSRCLSAGRLSSLNLGLIAKILRGSAGGRGRAGIMIGHARFAIVGPEVL